jgi:hypothetical protein
VKDALVIVVGGQHQDPGTWKFAADGPDRSGAVELRHGQIHQDDVRIQLTELTHGFLPILGEPYNSHIRLEFQHGGKTIADDGVVFGDQNPNAVRHWE